MSKITINAVHDSDLKGVMKGLGLWKDFKKGRLKCVCGEILTDESLTALKAIDGEVRGLCQKCFMSHT